MSSTDMDRRLLRLIARGVMAEKQDDRSLWSSEDMASAQRLLSEHDARQEDKVRRRDV